MGFPSPDIFFLISFITQGMILDPSQKCEVLARFQIKSVFCSQVPSEQLDDDVSLRTIHSKVVFVVT